MNKGHKGSSRTSKINPLALPKGTEKFCELCGKVARLQCAACQVTFYCDAEHQQADWVGIHKRICQLLVQIRDPGSHVPLSLCGIRTCVCVELIEICRFEAGSKLSQGKHQEALPAAQSGLRCLTDVHGSGSCELVPAYLLLAEANMGLGNISRVKELLSQAEWVVSKSPECTNEIHHRLHRSLGRLHVLTGDLEAALFHFANDIYYAAEAFGLESMVISRGYFLMAGVFVKQGKSPVASSLYSEVVRSWHAHLTELLQSHINSPDFSYDKSQQVEVDEMFRTMLEFKQKESRKDRKQEALLNHCLAMLWLLGGDTQKVSHLTGRGIKARSSFLLIPQLIEKIILLPRL
uniref:MYND-type domain-containing protein n=1 Tax=Salarias fasciatus TaxID=181472 RepID=A0A672IKF3_SALFA